MLVKNMMFKGLTEVIGEMLIEKKVLKAPPLCNYHWRSLCESVQSQVKTRSFHFYVRWVYSFQY